MKKILSIIIAVAAIVLLAASCKKVPQSLDGTVWKTEVNEAGVYWTLDFTSGSDVTFIKTNEKAETENKEDGTYTYTSKGSLTAEFDGHTIKGTVDDTSIVASDETLGLSFNFKKK